MRNVESVYHTAVSGFFFFSRYELFLVQLRGSIHVYVFLCYVHHLHSCLYRVSLHLFRPRERALNKKCVHSVFTKNTWWLKDCSTTHQEPGALRAEAAATAGRTNANLRLGLVVGAFVCSVPRPTCVPPHLVNPPLTPALSRPTPAIDR